MLRCPCDTGSVCHNCPPDAPLCLRRQPPNECPKGGKHQWGIDGQHFNEFCKKCFTSKPKDTP